MTSVPFRTLIVEETPDHRFVSRLGSKTVPDLPKGEVLIKVHYSSLNYKDALSAGGNKGVTRRYPHTPGIDAAGEVAHSEHSDFRAGDPVLVTGYDLGMNTSGGFGQYVRVPADWVVPLPPGLTLRESMIYGTAGFTAGLGLFQLEQAGLTPSAGEILVTGASGGVGSLAVALLAQRGFTVAAASGKAEAAQLLQKLGAQKILTRSEVQDQSGRPLLPGRYAGALDTVGGEILAFTLKSTRYAGAVACCGNAASADLHLTVYPFILRAVRLIGIDSAECPMEMRRKVWDRLAGDWKPSGLEGLAGEIGLAQVEPRLKEMLGGGGFGRTIVNLRDS